MNRTAKFLNKCTRKVFNLEGKYALISFRVIILLLLFFFALYGQHGLLITEELDSGLFRLLLILAGIQLLSNVPLVFTPEKFLKKGLIAGLFFFDIALISFALYWTQGFETDLFLIYFLVVFMATISRKSSVIFVVAGLACMLYGFIFLKSHTLSDLMQPAMLIRFPLLLVVAFLSSLIVQDIESEKEVLKAQVQAHWMRSEKLAALGEMASGIAHEINNPLTSILGTTQLILDKAKGNLFPLSESDPSKNLNIFLEDLLVIERNTTRCKKIVADLLKFVDEYEFHFEKIDVKQPILDALSLLQNQIKLSRINVTWKDLNEQENRFVNASPLHLEQVFFNLIHNSIQAMPNGGTITLAIERKRILSKRNIPSEYVDVIIQDTGIGIPKENLDRLFEPFFTTKPTGNGTSLGLTVSHGIVSKHNGSIFAVSEGKNKGTKMTVRLPAEGAVHGVTPTMA